MKKRIISLALAIMLTLAFVPTALAAKTYIEVIPPTFEDAHSFFEGLAGVKLNGKWGYIDKTGKVVIEYKYDWVGWFIDGETVAGIGEGDDGTTYAINKAGEVLYEVEPYDPEEDPDSELHFSEGLRATKDGDWEDNGKYGYVDKDWKTVISPRFDSASEFIDGIATVEIDEKWGCIDKTGKEVVEIKYEYVGYFSEGLTYASLDGKFGFIDKTGNVVIPFTYNDVRGFGGGFAAVGSGEWSDRKWGFINKAGVYVVPPTFDYVGYDSTTEGLIPVRFGDWDTGKWGYIAITLAGAAEWATSELVQALEHDLIFDEMVGKWSQPTNRLLAAEAIVKLVEAITDMSIGEIAEEMEFDMEDTFSDTDNEAVTFLKASGISNGVDGVRYDPNGTFTRA